MGECAIECVEMSPSFGELRGRDGRKGAPEADDRSEIGVTQEAGNAQREL